MQPNAKQETSDDIPEARPKNNHTHSSQFKEPPSKKVGKNKSGWRQTTFLLSLVWFAVLSVLGVLLSLGAITVPFRLWLIGPKGLIGFFGVYLIGVIIISIIIYTIHKTEI